MEWLAVDDVEQIVHLVSCAANPTAEIPIPERKQLLLEGVAKLVGADIWFWSTFVTHPVNAGDIMATSVIDGGWSEDVERAGFFGVLTDPNLRSLSAKLLENSHGCHVTWGREVFAGFGLEQDFDAVLSRIGIRGFLWSIYPLAETAASGLGFYRRRGQPEFCNRDRIVVHLVFHQVDWLHRHGTNVPAKNKVLQLSPRERHVMVFLLGGDSPKEVARKLRLSEHTVGDYVKEIYRHFSVKSRAELLSHFIAGGER